MLDSTRRDSERVLVERSHREGSELELIFEGNDRAAIAAEGGDSLQVAVGARNRHHRSVAVDGMAGGSEVPASALGVFRNLSGRLAQRFLGRPRGDWQT